MLRNILLLVFVISAPLLFAQDLALKIYPPKLNTELDESVSDDFALKVTSIFSQHGVYNSNSSAIGVYPALSVLSENVLEGLQRKETVKLTFSLLTKNSITGEVFHTHIEQLAGVGKSRRDAMLNALQNINIDAPAYGEMLQNIQAKVSTYYAEKCSYILEQAATAEAQNDFEKAISLLNAVPHNNTCYAQVQEAQLATYLRYQKNSCDQFVQNAEIAITQEKFDTAIDWLSKIDVASPCAAEAKKLLVTAGEGVNQQNQAKLNFLNKVYQNKIKLETSRNKAMEQISSEYLKKN
jgi:hypothetical protein